MPAIEFRYLYLYVKNNCQLYLYDGLESNWKDNYHIDFGNKVTFRQKTDCSSIPSLTKCQYKKIQNRPKQKQHISSNYIVFSFMVLCISCVKFFVPAGSRKCSLKHIYNRKNILFFSFCHGAKPNPMQRFCAAQHMVVELYTTYKQNWENIYKQ